MKPILPFLLVLACVACAPKDNHAPVAKHVVFIGIDGWASKTPRTGEAVPSRKSTNSPSRWQPVNPYPAPFS